MARRRESAGAQQSLLGAAAADEPGMGSVEARLWPGAACAPAQAWALDAARGWRAAQDGALRCVLVGVDEAGRGPLAGPVSVAAAVLSPEQLAQRPGWLARLDDSKRLTERRRALLWPELARGASAWAIAHVHADHIDRVNILKATFHGMALVVERVLGLAPSAWPERPEVVVETWPSDAGALAPDPCWYADACDAPERLRGAHMLATAPLALDPSAARILVDGNARYHVGAPDLEVQRCAQEPIVKGDGLSLHIAAASILAKVSRDAVMERLDAVCPGYGLAGHKGYPTKAHKAALHALGHSPVHRRSFRY